MNKLTATLSSISRIIDSLYQSYTFYSKLINLNLDYLDFISPLYKQHEQFLFKMIKEYERLSRNEYILNKNFTTYIISYNNVGIMDECIQLQDKLINVYSEVIGEDILWEVLPLVAQHLTLLKTSKNLLLTYYEQYKNQNRNIKIDYSNHPSLIN